MSDRRSLLMSAAHGLRRVWWFVRRPIVVSAAGLVLDDEGRVLLVRQSYSTRRWTLPGGGVKRGETLLEAALREIHEEAGITVTAPDSVVLLGVYGNFRQGKSDHVALFVIGEWEQAPNRSLEISNVGFFAPTNWPEPMSQSVRHRIEEYLGRREINPRW